MRYVTSTLPTWSSGPRGVLALGSLCQCQCQCQRHRNLAIKKSQGISGTKPTSLCGGVSGRCCVWFLVAMLVAALNSGFCVRLLRAASTRLLRAAFTRGFFVRLVRKCKTPVRMSVPLPSADFKIPLNLLKRAGEQCLWPLSVFSIPASTCCGSGMAAWCSASLRV